MGNIETFTKQYIKTALWSSTDRAGDPLDADFDINDIDEAMIKDRPGDAGHDFWLTRNGHGAGFWDGQLLTERAQHYDEFTLYVGDDGKIHGG